MPDDEDDIGAGQLLAAAAAAVQTGDLGDAYRLLTRARDLAVGDPPALAAAELELGRVAAAFGDPEEARSQFDSALGRFVAQEDDRGRAEALFELGRLDAVIGANDVAKAAFRRAADLAKRHGMTELSARCQLEFAAVGAAMGDLRIAQLDLRAATASELWKDDRSFRAESALVDAEIAVRSEETDRALASLTSALELLPDDDARRAWLATARDEAAGGADLPVSLRRPVVDAEMTVTETAFTMVGLDANGDLEAATTVPPPAGPGATEAGEALVHGILDHRRIRLDGHPGCDLSLDAMKNAHGLALAQLGDGTQLLAFAVLAAGVDPDEDRVLRDSEPILAWIAGRWRTATTIGFGRHLLIRSGALTTIAERPISFVRWVGPTDHPMMGEWLELFSGLSQAWFSMIAADGPGARRLRATRTPLAAPFDPDLPEW